MLYFKLKMYFHKNRIITKMLSIRNDEQVYCSEKQQQQQQQICVSWWTIKIFDLVNFQLVAKLVHNNLLKVKKRPFC